MESIIVACITGGLALIGVIFTNAQSNKRVEAQLMTAQAVTDNKIENLTEEVRKHNSFAERIPTLEFEVRNLNSRVDRLERRDA